MAGRFRVLVCVGPTCGEKRGGLQILARMKELVADRGLEATVSVHRETCLGYCQWGPNLVVEAEAGPAPEAAGAAEADEASRIGAILYTALEPAEIGAVVDRHLAEGKIVWSLVGRRAGR